LAIFFLIFSISTYLIDAYKDRYVMRIYNNEVLALAGCKTIYEASVAYRTLNGQYPVNLITLGSAEPPYISEDLVKGGSHGYKYSYEATPSGFFVTASPLKFGKTGRFYFQINELKRLKVCDKEGHCMTENQYLVSLDKYLVSLDK